MFRVIRGPAGIASRPARGPTVRGPAAIAPYYTRLFNGLLKCPRRVCRGTASSRCPFGPVLEHTLRVAACRLD